MTDQDPNALIAKAVSADANEKWREWAWVECLRCSPKKGYATNALCPTCNGTTRIPRDFALPENTLLLIRWARGEDWWCDDEMGHDDGGAMMAPVGLVDVAFGEFVYGEITEDDYAKQVVATIAAARKAWEKLQ